MPTYDYECDACGHKFELYQSIMAEVETKCPQCKKKRLRRLIGTGAAIVFKGSGFYQTDYRSDSYKKSASSDKKSSDSSFSATSEGSKGDSKPAGDSSSASKSETAARSETKGKSEPAAKQETKTSKKPPKSD